MTPHSYGWAAAPGKWNTGEAAAESNYKSCLSFPYKSPDRPTYSPSHADTARQTGPCVRGSANLDRLQTHC